MEVKKSINIDLYPRFHRDPVHLKTEEDETRKYYRHLNIFRPTDHDLNNMLAGVEYQKICKKVCKKVRRANEQKNERRIKQSLGM